MTLQTSQFIHSTVTNLTTLLTFKQQSESPSPETAILAFSSSEQQLHYPIVPLDSLSPTWNGPREKMRKAIINIQEDENNNNKTTH